MDSSRLDGYEAPVESYPSYSGAQVSNGAKKIDLNDRLSSPNIENQESRTEMRASLSSPPSKLQYNGTEQSNGSQKPSKAPGPRKKRQAPLPPVGLTTDAVTVPEEKVDVPPRQVESERVAEPASHSRQSSDSSGYHENSSTSHSPGGKAQRTPVERDPRSCASSDVSSDPGAPSGTSDRTTSPSDWQDSLERHAETSDKMPNSYAKEKKHKAPPPPVLPEDTVPGIHF